MSSWGHTQRSFISSHNEMQEFGSRTYVEASNNRKVPSEPKQVSDDVSSRAADRSSAADSAHHGEGESSADQGPASFGPAALFRRVTLIKNLGSRPIPKLGAQDDSIIHGETRQPISHQRSLLEEALSSSSLLAADEGDGPSDGAADSLTMDTRPGTRQGRNPARRLLSSESR
eukprot:753509-Hanusia_phi.AAC.2